MTPSNDLFQVPEFSTDQPPETSGDVRFFPEVTPLLRRGNSGTSGGFPPSGEPPKVFPLRSRSEGNRQTSGRSEGLREKAARLISEIDRWEAEAARARSINEPHRDAFIDATALIEQLLSDRRRGIAVSKQTMLKAYDRRMAAGHAGHPSKCRIQVAEKILRDTRIELRAVNKEIGK